LGRCIAGRVDELGIEVEHGLRQPSHHRRGDLLSDDGDALGVGGGDRTRCQVAGVVRVAVTQPFLEACHPHAAQSIRSLIRGQQNQCGLTVCVVESPFQGWEILQQLSAQSVDCAVAIGCEIIAAGA
jgi:hypothetical protein